MHAYGLRKVSRWFLWFVFALYFVLAAGLLLASLKAHAQDLDKPMLVVATPELQGAYRGAVILVASMGGDQHVGVMLNKPTKLTMAQLFPTHEPSHKVADPVYFGGPMSRDNLFAMVQGESAPHPRSLELAPKVWLVFEAQAVDNIIEATPNAARYFAGFVGWRAGELAEEIKKGYFVVRPYDASKLFLPDTSPLWEQLSPKRGHVES